MSSLADSTAGARISSSAASNAASLIALQVGSRVVTFALNQALVRLTSAEAFGTVCIQLDFLLHSVLFLSREGIRGACLRAARPTEPRARAEHVERMRSTARLAAWIGLPLSLGACALFAYTATAEAASQPGFFAAIALYGVAALTGLLYEPSFVDSQVSGRGSRRVNTEALSVIVKTAITLLAVIVVPSPLIAFGIGHITYSIVAIVSYAWIERNDQLTRVEGPQRDGPTLWLAWALTKQSLVKQLLSEGDKLVVSRLCPLTDQGGYAVALGYARIIFQPIEESSRLFFGQAPTSPATIQSASTYVQALVHGYLLLALPFVFVARSYVAPVMTLVLGSSRWSPSGRVAAIEALGAYCFYIPVLGLNGVLEAFTQAIASEPELDQLSRVLAVCSAIYALALYALSLASDAPAPARLVYASIISMAVRASWNSGFTFRWLRQRGATIGPVRRLLPGWPSVLAFAAAGQAAERAKGHGLARHLAVGVATTAIALLITCVRYAVKLIAQRCDGPTGSRPGAASSEAKIECTVQYMDTMLDKFIVRYLLPRPAVVVPERQSSDFTAHRVPFCFDLSRDLFRSVGSELVRHRNMEAMLLEIVGVCMVREKRGSSEPCSVNWPV